MVYRGGLDMFRSELCCLKSSMAKPLTRKVLYDALWVGFRNLMVGKIHKQKITSVGMIYSCKKLVSVTMIPLRSNLQNKSC